jgi:hypothetical protein
VENRLLKIARNHLQETMTELSSHANLLEKSSKVMIDKEQKQALQNTANGIKITIVELQKNLEAMNFNLGDALL